MQRKKNTYFLFVFKSGNALIILSEQCQTAFCMYYNTMTVENKPDC